MCSLLMVREEDRTKGIPATIALGYWTLARNFLQNDSLYLV